MVSLVAIVVLLCVGAAVASPTRGIPTPELYSYWEDFKQMHGKSYSTGFELIRRMIWEDNVRLIQKHNLEYDLGQHSYYLGVNAFTDLTHEEFKAYYLGSKMSPKNSTSDATTYLLSANPHANPQAIDWRNKGYVTPVKNQGQCGSCWAFSTTGSLEGQHFRKTGQLVSLSEQQLVDCSASFGNNGCEGGMMDFGFKYIKENGLEAEAAYPYLAKDSKCNFNKQLVVAKDTGFVDIPKYNEEALKDAVANIGPISVAIDAGHRSFQLYKGGIYNEPDCSAEQLDHGVLAAGYGSDENKDYWLVKNSWGLTWGLNGYIKMSRNKNNQCGIASMASYPLV